MADIIVTTPMSEMENAKKEADNIINNNGGYYFRVFSAKPNVKPGDKVFYVENGYMRGFVSISTIEHLDETFCDTTGKKWRQGYYVFMDAKTWKWITPIKMKGFQNFRYLPDNFKYEIIGDWLDKMPEIKE